MSINEKQKTPLFVPKFSLASGNNYKGTLLLKPGIGYHVSANFQANSEYAVRGSVVLLDPTTGQILQKAASSTHSYSTAAQKEYKQRYVAGTTDYTDIVRTKIISIADELLTQYKKEIDRLRSKAIKPNDQTLSTLLDSRLNAFTTDVKSDSSRARIHRQLKKVAKAFGLRPLSTWSYRILRELESEKAFSREDIITLNSFLLFVFAGKSDEIESSKAMAAVKEYLEQHGSKDEKKRAQHSNALSTAILSLDAQNSILRKCWDALKQAQKDGAVTADLKNALGIMLILRGGMNVDGVCDITRDTVVIPDKELDPVTLLRERNYAGSATHDYRCPLCPECGSFVKKYLALFGDASEEELSLLYLIPADETGKRKYDRSILRDYCRAEVNRTDTGYARYAELPKASKNAVTVLQNCFSSVLKRDCGLASDGGAVNYLMGRSLAGNVQADNYRSFSDITGQVFLQQVLERIPVSDAGKSEMKDGYRRRSTAKGDDGRTEIRIPPRADGYPQVIEIHCNSFLPGDEIIISSAGGITTNILPE